MELTTHCSLPTLQSLPPEALAHIFGFLSPKERATVAGVNRLFQQIADDPHYWTKLIRRALGSSSEAIHGDRKCFMRMLSNLYGTTEPTIALIDRDSLSKEVAWSQRIFPWVRLQITKIEGQTELVPIQKMKNGLQVLSRQGDKLLEYERPGFYPTRVFPLSCGSIVIGWFESKIGSFRQYGRLEIGHFNRTQWVSEYEEDNVFKSRYFGEVFSFPSITPRFYLVFGEGGRRSECTAYRKEDGGWQREDRFYPPQLEQWCQYRRLSMCQWRDKSYLLALVLKESAPGAMAYEKELRIYDPSPGETTTFKSISLPGVNRHDEVIPAIVPIDIYPIPIGDSLLVNLAQNDTVTRIHITSEWEIKTVAKASLKVFGVSTEFAGVFVGDGEFNEVWWERGDYQFIATRLFEPATSLPSSPLALSDFKNISLQNPPLWHYRLISFGMFLISLSFLVKLSRGNPKWIKWTSTSMAVGVGMGSMRWLTTFKRNEQIKSICWFSLFSGSAVLVVGLLYQSSLEVSRKVGYATASLSLALGIWSAPMPFFTPTPRVSGRTEPFKMALKVTESIS